MQHMYITWHTIHIHMQHEYAVQVRVTIHLHHTYIYVQDTMVSYIAYAYNIHAYSYVCSYSIGVVCVHSYMGW